MISLLYTEYVYIFVYISLYMFYFSSQNFLNTYLYDEPHGEKGNKLGKGSISKGGKPGNVEAMSSGFQKLLLKFVCELLCDEL